jgi:hypothetical protein
MWPEQSSLSMNIISCRSYIIGTMWPNSLDYAATAAPSATHSIYALLARVQPDQVHGRARGPNDVGGFIDINACPTKLYLCPSHLLPGRICVHPVQGNAGWRRDSKREEWCFGTRPPHRLRPVDDPFNRSGLGALRVFWGDFLLVRLASTTDSGVAS